MNESYYRRVAKFSREFGESPSYPVNESFKIRRYWAIAPNHVMPEYWMAEF